MKLFITALLCAMSLGITINAQDLLFVKENATGDGSSWTTATNLQKALSIAKEGTQIWVAKGIYLPTKDKNRDASFSITKNLKLYGGFIGNETAINQRDIRLNKTILSGEINSKKIDDNSYTVVYIENATNSTVIDGFTIKGGFATGSTQAGTTQRCGGAIFNNGNKGAGSNPIISNCVFQDNIAREGGAIYNYASNGSSSPIISNCTFTNNQADLDGGAIYNNASNGKSNPLMINCTFKDNLANYGAGIYSNTKNGSSNISLKNCAFKNNMASMWGGGIFGNEKAGLQLALTNCTFNENYPTDINKEITVGKVNTARTRDAK